MEKLQIEMSEINVQDRKVFRLLFDTFFVRACVFAGHLLNDREAGTDVVQEVFLTIWQQEKSFPNLSFFKSYLYTCLKNKCLNMLRNTPRMMDVSEIRDMPSMETGVESLIIKQEVKGRIVNEINKLPSIKRQIMLLRLEGRSYEDISEELGLALNTVKAHKKESYKQLRLGLSKGEKLIMMCLIVLAYWLA